MGIFRKKAERTVTVRRIRAAETKNHRGSGQNNTGRLQQRDGGGGGSENRRSSVKTRPSRTGRSRPQESRGGRKRQRSSRDRMRDGVQPPHLDVTPPPDTARLQMLIRGDSQRTQIAVLEGPTLVEYYIAGAEKESLVGNVYLGSVRNVLPGMEAAFVDFGAGKNGVLYSADVHHTDSGTAKRKVRIEKIFKPGDSVLVGVVKDAIGRKGARLTAQISLAGRYLVLAGDPDVRGISRRLSEDERRRLRSLSNELRPEGRGIIVRTAAEGASREDLQADISRLQKIWSNIEANTDKAAPALVHQEPPLVLRVIREQFTKDFRRLLIDNRSIYDEALTYLEATEPDLALKVSLYEDELSLFERFHIGDQLRRALDRTVRLPSGGHIVIERTEALTVVDVNTGRFVGDSNLEKTVLQNNLEAAEEIARQLRLRDIGGIIVIDFIDMEIEKSQEKVLQKLRQQLSKDRRRTQVFEMSHLGLVEMTRKKVSEDLLESFSDVCSHCSGRGVLLHEDSTSAKSLQGSGDRV